MVDLWASMEGDPTLSLSLAITDLPDFISDQDPSAPSKTHSSYTSPCETPETDE